MNLSKDNYYIKFMISTCKFEIRINDIPLLRSPGPGSTATQIYINQYINSGGNVFSVNMVQNDEKGFEATSHCDAQILHIKDGKETVLAEGNWRWDGKNKIPAANVTAPFAIKEAITPESPWLKNPVKDLSNDQRASINHKFRQIVDAFKNKDLEKVISLGSLKDNFFAERLHLDKNARSNEIRSVFGNLFNNCSFFEHEAAKWVFKAYAAGRIYTFELANNLSPVEFHKNGSAQKANVPVLLTINENNEVIWVL